MKSPITKNPLFYGVIGIVSVALLSLAVLNTATNNNEESSKIISKNSENLPEDTKCIHPPIKDVTIEFIECNYNSAKDSSIILPSGTKISLPKKSIITDSKNTEVTLRIREFKNKSDVLIAGIPMDYEKNKAFESAGMIEIRGFQNNKEVYIDAKKPINVNLVLNKNASHFDFWKLNEVKSKWEKFNVISKEKRLRKVDLTNELALENKKKVEIENLLIHTKEKLIKNSKPEREAYFLPIDKKQRFDLEFNEHEFPELSTMKGMEFEVATKQPYDKSFTEKVWNDVNLIKENGDFYAVFSSKKDIFKIQVRPVLTGKEKQIAEVEFSKLFDNYLITKNKLEDELKKIEELKINQQKKYDLLVSSLVNKNQQSQEVNTDLSKNNTIEFNITSFGVYNCDRPNNYPPSFESDLVFSIGNSHTIAEIQEAYVFDNKLDVRFSYGANNFHSISELGFFRKNSSVLVVIDKNGKVGYKSNFNLINLKDEMVKLERLDKEDLNIGFIQKIIDKSSAII